MAPRVRSSKLENRSARLRLARNKKPYSMPIIRGVMLPYRRNKTAGTCSVRDTRNGGERHDRDTERRLGSILSTAGAPGGSGTWAIFLRHAHEIAVVRPAVRSTSYKLTTCGNAQVVRVGPIPAMCSAAKGNPIYSIKSSARTAFWKRKKGRLAWAALLAPAAGPISPPSQQPRARLPNQLVDKSHCRCANDNATSVTGKPKPRSLHQVCPLSPLSTAAVIADATQLNAPSNLCGWLRPRPRTATQFSPSLALLVDGSDSPPVPVGNSNSNILMA
jgi:hypothetical protein